MKKGINLIRRQKKYLRYENFFKILRTLLVVVSVIFFIIFIFSFGITAQNNRKLNDLYLEKKNLLEYLANNKEVEAEFTYFRNKYTQLRSIIDQDVNFLPYYNLLTESLKQASPSPILDAIIITKDRTVNFTLRFDNPSSITSFLKFAESESFLKNFAQLFVGQFNLESKKGIQNYQLLLVGKLNPINEIKN
jgi:hypothetical protein